MARSSIIFSLLFILPLLGDQTWPGIVISSACQHDDPMSYNCKKIGKSSNFKHSKFLIIFSCGCRSSWTVIPYFESRFVQRKFQLPYRKWKLDDNGGRTDGRAAGRTNERPLRLGMCRKFWVCWGHTSCRAAFSRGNISKTDRFVAHAILTNRPRPPNFFTDHHVLIGLCVVCSVYYHLPGRPPLLTKSFRAYQQWSTWG